jgi:hypothetical protein
VLSAEGLTKLSPLHLVSRTSDTEVGPPCPGVTEQLLNCELSLLVLSAAEKPKLGLDGAKPIISLEWFSCFCEGWRMGCQELRVSARGLTLSIPGTMAAMGGVGHEQAEQLGLLVP